MNTKRMFGFLVLGLFMISMMGGVLAKTAAEIGQDVGGFFSGLGSGVQGFFSSLGIGSFDSGILSQLFFAILLGMIIYTIVSSFFSESGALIQWGITGAITFIAFFGIPAGYLEALRVSYGAMGLTLLTVIPFLIMVVFSVKVKDLMIARGTWGFYIVYYFFLIIQKWWGLADDVSGVPYWIAFLGGIFMFFTIPYFRYWNNEQALSALEEKAETAINRNIGVQKLAKKSREGEVGAAINN
ncbi:MAG: hypothetical protein V1888_01965 [archaeon]